MSFQDSFEPGVCFACNLANNSDVILLWKYQVDGHVN